MDPDRSILERFAALSLADNSAESCASESSDTPEPLALSTPSPLHFHRWNTMDGYAHQVPADFFRTDEWKELCVLQNATERDQMASLRRLAYAASPYRGVLRGDPSRNQYCLRVRPPYLRHIVNIHRNSLGDAADHSDTYALAKGILCHPVVNPDSDAVGRERHPALAEQAAQSGRRARLEQQINDDIILHRLHPDCSGSRVLDIPSFEDQRVLIISNNVFGLPSWIKRLQKAPYSAGPISCMHQMPTGAIEKPGFIIVPEMTPTHVENLLEFRDDAWNTLAADGRLILFFANNIHVQDATELLDEAFECEVQLLQPHTSWREISPRMRYLVVAKPREPDIAR